MADRFPLIVDSTTQTIKELPSGDNLDLTGSSIVNASSIDVTGTVTADGVTSDGNISMSGAGTGARFLLLGSETNTYAGSLIIQAGGGSAAYGGGLIAYGHSHASKAGDIVAGISSGSGGSFRVNTSGIDTGGDVFVVEAGGNVGIGTDSPNAPLTVQAATSSSAINLIGRLSDGYSSLAFRNNANDTSLAAIYADDSSDSMQIFVAGSEAMRIDADGNVGIGCTPEDWDPAFDVLRVGKTASLFSYDTAGDGLWLGSNAFYDDTLNDYKYITTDPASLYTQLNGTHSWSYAASGTADTQVTFSEAMRIDASGNLLVGDTSTVPFDGTSGVLIGGARTSLAFATTGHTHKMLYSVNTGTAGLHFYDSTNNRTDMIWDNSGNLLVGTTSTNPYTSSTETGAVVRGDEGILGASRDGGPSLRVNRIGTGGTEEGDIAEFRSNGVTVGSIGTASTALYIANNDTGLQLYGGGATDQIVPCDGSGATRDNAIDLGKTTGRFKDLYLSGFVSDGGDTGLTTRAIINGGVTALRLQQARGSLTSPTISNFDGDGNYIVSEVYDGSSFNKIAHIGMVTGTSLDDGEILFGTAKAGTVTNKMVLNEDGNLLVGTTAGGSYRLTSTVPSGADRDVFLAGVTLATNGLAIQWKHATTSLSVKFNDILTTASAANAYLDSGAGNELYRSTSSIRYKKDVESIDEQHSSNVLNLRPVWYRSKAAGDNANHSFYGLIAEEVAEIEPRLVHWAYAEKDYDVEEVEGSIKKTPKPDAQKIPDGVQYERLAVLLLDVVKKQSAQIDDLRARVAALES